MAAILADDSEEKPLTHLTFLLNFFRRPAAECAGREIMPLTPGEKLGPYEILSAIGAGGMGEVYNARDTRLDRILGYPAFPLYTAFSGKLVNRRR